MRRVAGGLPVILGGIFLLVLALPLSADEKKGEDADKKGTVVIDIATPDTQVVINRDGKQVVVVKPKGKQEVKLQPGSYKVEIKKDGLIVSTADFTLQRGGKQVVTVRLEKKGEDKDFVKLFNGKDLSGWKVHPNGTGNWKVEDGAIVGSGQASHLFTDRGDYVDFHLRAEVMINDKGNSGMYYRTQFGPGFPKGYEAQINSTGRDPIKTGSLYPAFNRQLKPQDRQKILIMDQLVKPGEFFTYEVICRGDHMVIKVNGKTTVDFKDPFSTFKKGHFAFQQHDPGSVVKIRKVEVKELPAEKE